MEEETLRLAIQQVLYDSILGTSDPDIPRDEYAAEATQLAKWISAENTNRAADAGAISHQLATIFSTMLDDVYDDDDFRNIAKDIVALIR